MHYMCIYVYNYIYIYTHVTLVNRCRSTRLCAMRVRNSTLKPGYYSVFRGKCVQICRLS